jgi:hypothetical protein
MNAKLIYSVLGISTLLVSGSCKIYESKYREEEQLTAMEWKKQEQARRWYTLQQDTLSRFWYFWTDSTFRFHPDSGLLAASGDLILQEAKKNSKVQAGDWAEKSEQGKRMN